MICVIIFYQKVLKDQKLDLTMQGIYHFVLVISISVNYNYLSALMLYSCSIKFIFCTWRQRKWVPEQDLMKSFGTLTQFGLREALKDELYKNSQEGIAKCQWWSTYREEIGELKLLNIEQDTQ